MKLFRYGCHGAERPGIVNARGTAVDVGHLIADFDAVMLTPQLRDVLTPAHTDPSLPSIDLNAHRIGAPLARPGTIFCIGLNYRDHAEEAGMAIPSEPVLFSKAGSALSGPYDPIPFGADMTKLDWEVELAVVIGTSAFRVTTDQALDHVFGYAVVNDVSERAWQLERAGQWMKGKSHPGFCPLGPWLITVDEVPDPQALTLRCSVNGIERQAGTTANMIFSVAELVSYLSRFTRLQPGDVICTGTPAGVGAGFKPPIFLGVGDKVELTIDGLGVQRQSVTAS